jgi:hypothetical protein
LDVLLGKKSKRGIENKPQRDLIVRLIEPHSRPPVTPVERLAVSMLKREGKIPLRLLVEGVASDLYEEELRNGAWILDIGLFGSRLFVPEVAGEIKARDGTLWQIEKPEKF